MKRDPEGARPRVQGCPRHLKCEGRSREGTSGRSWVLRSRTSRTIERCPSTDLELLVVTHQERQRAPERGRMGSGNKRVGRSRGREPPSRALDQGSADRILGVLADVPTNSTGATLLDIDASIVTAQPNEGMTNSEHDSGKTGYS